jgi:hypothetical protein
VQTIEMQSGKVEFFVGLAQFLLDNVDEAKQRFDEILRRETGNGPTILTVLSHLLLGDVHDLAKDDRASKEWKYCSKVCNDLETNSRPVPDWIRLMLDRRLAIGGRRYLSQIHVDEASARSIRDEEEMALRTIPSIDDR